jgi:hypothetical protein
VLRYANIKLNLDFKDQNKSFEAGNTKLLNVLIESS